jgi:hypothetical protein
MFSVFVTQCMQHRMKGKEGTEIGAERRWRNGKSCPGICRERLMKTTEYVRFGLSCSQNSSGCYMYCQLTLNKFYVLPTQCICVLCGSENKQQLFPYTTLTAWFL